MSLPRDKKTSGRDRQVRGAGSATAADNWARASARPTEARRNTQPARHSDLLRYRLLHCARCQLRTWIIGDDAPHCACGTRDWWEDHSFFARDEGPGLAPTQLQEVSK